MRLTVPAGLLLVAAAQGCGDSTSSDTSGPPPREHVFSIGDTIVDTISGVRYWYFPVTAGQEVNVFVQALGKPTDHDKSMALYLTDSAGRQLGPSVETLGTDSSLEMRSMGRIVFPKTGHYGLGAAWCCPQRLAYTGPYRFWVYPINRAPESVDSLLPLGDTISDERIDHVGDVDTWHYTAAPGELFNLFVRARGHFLDAVYARVPALQDVIALSRGTDTALAQRATGDFVDSAGGARTLEVYGEHDNSEFDHGPYQVMLYPINWAPETVPAELAPGDSVTTEAIEALGDIDEFIVRLPGQDSMLVNAVLTGYPTGPVDAPGMWLIDSLQNRRVLDPRIVGVANYGSMGDFWLQPGQEYALRIAAYSIPGGYVGPYQLHLYSIDRAPESLPPLFSVGDTLTGEALDVPGDIDTFQFDATAGEFLTVSLQGDAAPEAILKLTAPDDTVPGRDFVRIFVPPGRAGRWTAEISPSFNTIQTLGPYRLSVTRIPTTPETHPDTFRIGDSVTTEALDYPGDVDQFRLLGAPGQTTILTDQVGSGVIEFIDPATQLPYDTLGDPALIRLPASGELQLRVLISPLYTGYYRIKSYANTYGPETIGSQVTIGDTVAGEGITPQGDVDEFQFAATMGQSLTVQFQPLGISVSDTNYLALDVVDTVTQTILGTVHLTDLPANLEDETTGPFPIPRDDTYLIRIRGTSYFETTMDKGYRFRIVPLN